MDIFRYLNPTNPTKMEQGVFVNDLLSKMWVERYREAGEFRFTAKASSGVREQLPLGSFISRPDAEEIMIVENHEISDVRGEDPEIVITGRGFETVLEGRVVGSNLYFPFFPAADYAIAANYSWLQAQHLLEHHIYTAHLIDPNDAIPFVTVLTDVPGTSVSAERSVQRGDLYTRLMEILEVDDLGIKVIRPGPWSPVWPDPSVCLILHVGTDRTDEVIFSYDTGEIESSDYLWSRKNNYNSAMVSGRFVQIRVDSLDPAEVGYGRRTLYVDASDIDEMYPETPTDPVVLNSIYVKMEQRGQEAIAAARGISLTKTEVSQDHITTTFRKDFNVGDLITVSGAYSEITSTRRVSEFVEIEDETGIKAYPTLTMD